MTRLVAKHPFRMLGLAGFIAAGILLGVASTRAQFGTPTVNFMTETWSVSESMGKFTVYVYLSSPSMETVTVQYATADGSATGPADYQAGGGTIAFPPGLTSQTITLTVVDDQIAEGTETFTVSLSNAQNATIGLGVCTISITDGTGGGGGGPPTVQFSATSYTVAENGGSKTVDVTLSAAAPDTVTVAYATANGTATAGSDYTAASGTLTFNPGETSKSFAVTILDDTEYEGDETISLTLSAPTNANLGTPSLATLTITDNEMPPPPLPVVQFVSNTYSVLEGGGSATIGVTLSEPAQQIVTVNYQTSVPFISNVATPDEDYTATSGTLTFSYGESSKTFSVPILQDTLVEGDEVVGLVLFGPTNATLGISSATLTITDDDQTLPTVQFSAATYSVFETQPTATITVTLSALSPLPVTVAYFSSDGSATTPSDYLPAVGQVEFQPGEMAKSFTVDIVFDGEPEGDETVNLTLSGPTNATLGNPATAVLTIKNVNVELKLKDVGFSGSGFTTVHESFTHQGPYDAPHWLDANVNGSTGDEGDRDYPICFTRATTMQAKATFQVTSSAPAGTPLPAYVKIWADEPTTPEGKQLNIPATQIPLGFGDCVLPPTNATDAFQDQIDYFEPLTLAWKYQFDNAVNSSSAGSSKNLAFVTLSTPEAMPFSFSLSLVSVGKSLFSRMSLACGPVTYPCQPMVLSCRRAI